MKTTKEHIKELHNILVQTCIDFINKYELEDAEAVEFSADDLQMSSKHKKWVPATDSHLAVKGIEWEDVKLSDGRVVQVPYYFNIGESM